MHILMYHQVSEESQVDIMGVSKSNFREQLSWIKDHGYRVITLSSLNRSESAGLSFPGGKTIAITFDDGYLDTYTTAWPILQDFGFTATVFLVSGWVGKTSGWREDRYASTPLMNWRQAQELYAGNIQIGSHSVTHPWLAKINAEKVAEEILDSRKQIEDRVGVEVYNFSYPYSSTHPEARRILKDGGYLCACTHRDHYVGSAGVDPYSLQRIGILARDNLADFAEKVRPSLHRRLRWMRVWFVKYSRNKSDSRL